MNDKMIFLASPFFCLTHPEDKFVCWDEGKQTWVFDEERFFNFQHDFANRGVNMERWLGWNCWTRWKVNGQWVYGPAPARTNLTPFLVNETGKYQLDVRNDKYWEIHERAARITNYPSQKEGNLAPGIIIHKDLIYQYTGNPGDIGGSPWRNNTFGITSLYDDAAWSYFEAYVMEWIKLKRGYTDEKGIVHPPLKIEFGLGNELAKDSLGLQRRLLRLLDREKIWPFSYGICPSVPYTGDVAYKSVFKIIRDENLFTWHPLRSGDYWDTSIMRRAHGSARIVDGISCSRRQNEYWALHPIRYIKSDDGDDPKPGAAWWAAEIEELCTMRNTDALTFPWQGIDKPIIGVEHLPDDEPWDESCDEQLNILEVMGRTYAKYFPPLENFGKWPDKWVAPTPPVPPTPPTPPVTPPPTTCGKTRWYQHLKTWNFKAAFAHLIGKHKNV